MFQVIVIVNIFHGQRIVQQFKQKIAHCLQQEVDRFCQSFVMDSLWRMNRSRSSVVFPWRSTLCLEVLINLIRWGRLSLIYDLL